MNYRFTESDELLYEMLCDTTTVVDLSIKKNMLKYFEELKMPTKRIR